MAKWLEYYFSSIHVLTGVNMFGSLGRKCDYYLTTLSSNAQFLTCILAFHFLKQNLNAYWLDCVIAEQNNVVESHNVKRKVILDHI